MFDDQEVVTPTENQDSTNTEVEDDLDFNLFDDPVKETKEDGTKVTSDELARLKEQNAQLYARLKKVEQKTKTGATVSGDNNTIDLDILEFFSKGNTKEDYNNAVAIMKGKGITFEQALIDPLYIAHKQVAQAKAKRTASQLGASKSVGSTAKDGVKPGMTTEEHKAYAAKIMRG